MLVLSWLIQCLLILLSVAFFTLFERKLMGLFHLRLGPNNVSFVGLVQPLLDAFKLLSKQDLSPLRSNKVAYSLSPIFSLLLAFLVWITLPLIFSVSSLNLSLVLFFCITSFIVFGVLVAGWSSNSNYSLIGSLRSVSQSVSYESVFSTLLVALCFLGMSFSISGLKSTSSLLGILFLPIWTICTLAEAHRAPFDFSESESELVSGFNTEYSGAFFAFIFLSEYAVLLYSCVLITYLFFSWFISLGVTSLTVMALAFSFLFTWIRITFCRFRYDLLMMLAWNLMLPLTLSLFIVVIILVV